MKEMISCGLALAALPGVLVVLAAVAHFIVVVYFVSWGFPDHANSVNSNPNTCEGRLVAMNF